MSIVALSKGEVSRGVLTMSATFALAIWVGVAPMIVSAMILIPGQKKKQREWERQHEKQMEEYYNSNTTREERDKQFDEQIWKQRKEAEEQIKRSYEKSQKSFEDTRIKLEEIRKAHEARDKKPSPLPQGDGLNERK